jgi:hypothetical protein
MIIRPDQLIARLIAAAQVVCSALSVFVFGPAKAYQPEKHYMRGPGPKWRAKHGVVQLLAHDEFRG